MVVLEEEKIVRRGSKKEKKWVVFE